MNRKLTLSFVLTLIGLSFICTTALSLHMLCTPHAHRLERFVSTFTHPPVRNSSHISHLDNDESEEVAFISIDEQKMDQITASSETWLILLYLLTSFTLLITFSDLVIAHSACGVNFSDQLITNSPV